MACGVCLCCSYLRRRRLQALTRINTEAVMATYRGSRLEQNGRSLVEGRNAGMHRDVLSVLR
jgi:hypothetical protein